MGESVHSPWLPLFHTGRPVMMHPHTGGCAPGSLAEIATIAWNRSLETTRAVALALGLIKSAWMARKCRAILYIEEYNVSEAV